VFFVGAPNITSESIRNLSNLSTLLLSQIGTEEINICNNGLKVLTNLSSLRTYDLKLINDEGIKA
jgi:hypothetical protein